jgi:predicted phage terminase large subunit-like protein
VTLEIVGDTKASSFQRDNETQIIRGAIDAAQKDLLAYCMLMNPNFIVGPHHRYMADKLMAVRRGEIKRLMIFIAPRSTKSLMSSVYFPSWCLGQMPSWQIMSVSYSGDLARDWGREVRNIIRSDEYGAVYQDVGLRADSQSAGRWHTSAGGVYTSAGITGGIAGRGANLAIIDDPLSEQDAWSKTAREHVIRWYPGGLRTRLMPGGRIVVIQTRWHEEDLSGFLLAESTKNPQSDKWEVIKIPAILDEQSALFLGNAREELIEQGYINENYPEIKAGETYWPVAPEYQNVDAQLRGWKTEELLKTKQNTPPYQWSALYMQTPTPEEGGILKKEWWKEWTHPSPPICDYIIISADTAFETKESSDYSAFTIWGVFRDDHDLPNLMLLGAKKDRWIFPDLRDEAKRLYKFHDPDMFLIEKKASGQSLLQELNATGIPAMPFEPERDKVARAHSCTPTFHSGKIWYPSGKRWAQEVIDECATFPNGMWDDYVDTTTQAIIWLRRGAWVSTEADDFGDEEHTKTRKQRKFY